MHKFSPRIFTQQEDCTMTSMYTSGNTLKEIGVVLGMHQGTVHRRLKVLGVKMRPAKKRPGPKKVIKPKVKRSRRAGISSMRKMYLGGMTLREIGLVVHADGTTVSRWLRKAGVTLRKPKEKISKVTVSKFLCEADIQEAIKDKLLGLSWRELANHYKLTYHQAYNLIKPRIDLLYPTIS